MTTKPTPQFTDAAAQLWATVPADTQKQLLSNVWCASCGRGVIIKNFTGVLKNADLLLVGNCSECHADVGRLVEMPIVGVKR